MIDMLEFAAIIAFKSSFAAGTYVMKYVQTKLYSIWRISAMADCWRSPGYIYIYVYIYIYIYPGLRQQSATAQMLWPLPFAFWLRWATRCRQVQSIAMASVVLGDSVEVRTVMEVYAYTFWPLSKLIEKSSENHRKIIQKIDQNSVKIDQKSITNR